MTKEQAIDLLDNLIGFVEDNHGSDYDEALKMAIEALEEQQNIHEKCKRCVEFSEFEQEPCEDAISRRAVVKVLNTMDRYVADELTLCDTKRKFPENEVFIVDDVYEEIVEQLPSITPQQKTGRWISDAIQGEIDGQIVKSFVCSECGAISVFRMGSGIIVNGDLCPNCGAKMAESEEK